MTYKLEIKYRSGNIEKVETENYHDGMSATFMYWLHDGNTMKLIPWDLIDNLTIEHIED